MQSSIDAVRSEVLTACYIRGRQKFNFASGNGLHHPALQKGMIATYEPYLCSSSIARTCHCYTVHNMFMMSQKDRSLGTKAGIVGL